METKLISRRTFSTPTWGFPAQWAATLLQVGDFYEVKVTRLDGPGGSSLLTPCREKAFAAFWAVEEVR